MNFILKEWWAVLESKPPDGLFSKERLTDTLILVEDLDAAVGYMKNEKLKRPEAFLYTMKVFHLVEGEDATCVRCGSPLAKTKDLALACTDQTCPFSRYAQDDDKGWIGHPSRPDLEDAE